MTTRSPLARSSVRCLLFGHRVHHTSIDADAGTPCVRCGNPILDQGETVSHISHTLSCFLGRHHYVRIARRNAHNEYVCERCGHPLLFDVFRDPYSSAGKFAKKVSYGCGLLGHRVHVVATRSDTTEYACGCGHSFVRPNAGEKVIRHPLACIALAHCVKANEIRGDWAEYVCGRCGHPFCFKLAAAARRESPVSAPRLKSFG